MSRPEMVCQGCGKGPLELGGEYRHPLMSDEDDTPTDQEVLDFCWSEEGTMNYENGHFLCNACYIKAGMPSSPRGWTCP